MSTEYCVFVVRETRVHRAVEIIYNIGVSDTDSVQYIIIIPAVTRRLQAASAACRATARGHASAR